MADPDNSEPSTLDRLRAAALARWKRLTNQFNQDSMGAAMQPHLQAEQMLAGRPRVTRDARNVAADAALARDLGTASESAAVPPTAPPASDSRAYADRYRPEPQPAFDLRQDNLQLAEMLARPAPATAPPDAAPSSTITPLAAGSAAPAYPADPHYLGASWNPNLEAQRDTLLAEHMAKLEVQDRRGRRSEPLPPTSPPAPDAAPPSQPEPGGPSLADYAAARDPSSARFARLAAADGANESHRPPAPVAVAPADPSAAVAQASARGPGVDADHPAPTVQLPGAPPGFDPFIRPGNENAGVAPPPFPIDDRPTWAHIADARLDTEPAAPAINDNHVRVAAVVVAALPEIAEPDPPAAPVSVASAPQVIRDQAAYEAAVEQDTAALTAMLRLDDGAQRGEALQTEASDITARWGSEMFQGEVSDARAERSSLLAEIAREGEGSDHKSEASEANASKARNSTEKGRGGEGR